MACVGSAWRAIFLRSAFAVVAAVVGPGIAKAQSTYLPSIKIGTAALIAPVSANTYYGSNTTSTDGLSGLTNVETPTSPELVELARALKNDPDLIYQYVHNNIQTVWMYGLQKGALGAEIDKSGTPFDQAELMMALLRQSNITASYIAGTVQFNQAQFSAWTGITGARTACQLLANGGIPATVNGVNNAACSTLNVVAQVSTVEMAHVWLKVTISGTQYVFDPSYKTYTYKTGLQLGTVMGLSPGQTLIDAMNGSSTGTDSVGGGNPVSFVQTLNAGKLNTDLQNYASALLSYIQMHNMQGAQIEDIVGGGVIVPDNSTLRQITLPYADPTPPYVFHNWTPPADAARYNAIPDQYRTTLTVEGKTQQYQLIGGVYTLVPVEMFNPTQLFVDEIYGRRLSVETDFSSVGIGTTQPEYYNQRACLALDAGPITSWQPQPPPPCLVNYFYSPPSGLMARTLPTNILLTANHPYAAANDGTPTANGTYMDATVNKPVTLITSLSIVHGWGDASAALFSKWSGERAEDAILPTLFTAPKCPGGEGGEGDLCPQNYLQPTGDFAREKAGGAWLAQFSRAAKLNAAMANAVPQIHHALGVVFGESALQGVSNYPQQPPGMQVADNFDRIDVDAGISVSARTSTTAATSARRGAILTLAASSAALEGSISGQLEDVVDMSSTPTRFEWGNSPDPDHSSTGQNPFSIGPQKFYQYDSTNYTEVAGPPGQKLQGLSRVDGDATGSCSGTGTDYWPLPPTNTPMGCYGSSDGITPGATNQFAGWIAPYAQAGFTVVASKEVFLGPGQRGGEIFPTFDGHGNPINYSHAATQQRGGAFVALQVDSNGDPVQIAHIIIGGGGITKGGGGGTQPDDQTTYDPATAAEILKTRFVDRSKLLGVDLANGSLGTTSPVSISTGNGGAPYELSAALSWHPGPASSPFAPQSPIEPQPGWDQSWLNSLNFSGSGMEAMGASDIRGAIGAIVSFYTAQDIYQATESPGREVAGVLTQSWWAHQLTDNVATTNVGGNTRQFVRIATGDWISPGGGYAAGLQTGTRVAYEDKCFHVQLDQPPYALSRGWDSSNVSFAVTNAQGDVENFGYFMNPYYTDDIRKCGKLKGFRLTSWTYPYGVTLTPTYAPETVGLDQLDALTVISNSVGRSLSFGDGTITAGSRSISYGYNNDGSFSATDPLTNTTSYTFQPGQPMSATQRPVPYSLLASVTTPDVPAQHNTEYTYDSLGRIKSVKDAVAIQQGGRNPYTFLIADGTRGERDDPLGQAYAVIYDTYGHTSRYIDEVGAETDALLDSRGRALQYVYPEGDCESFAYDDHNNTTDLWKVDKASSCNIAAGPTHVLHVSATWDSGWNKPLTVTDANGNMTTLQYFASGSGASELEQAIRPQILINGVLTSPIYQFQYDTAGKLTDMTSPTGIVTHHDFGAYENLTDTIVDYGTGTSHLNLKTQFGYDPDGNVNLTTDPNLNITSTMWDANRRKVEDDHHVGTTLNAAEKTLYDQINRVTDNQVGTAFSGTTVTTWLTIKHTTYTPTSKVQAVTDADSRVTTTAYDNADRTLTVTDPVSRNVHFAYCGAGSPNCAANQVKTEYRAWVAGTGCSRPNTFQECYRRVTYFADGEQRTIEDANGNTTNYSYDGWNRLNVTTFPDTTTETIPLAGGYDANGNVLQRVNRNGQTINYSYNALNWIQEKDVPATGIDTTWKYLLDGRIDVLQDNATSANIIDYGYDTAGRMNQVVTKISGFNTNRTVNYQLDANGNRTQLKWPTQDAAYAVNYCYDNLNRMTGAIENATDPTCATNVLATYAYDPQSRRTSVAYGNGASMTYTSYTNAGDLQTLNENFTGTSNDNTFSYGYTPAHQTLTIAASNSAFFWQPSANSSTNYTPNTLNQYSAIGSQTAGGTSCQGAAQGLSYDCNGNLTFDGIFTYTYDPENRLVTATKTGNTVQATYTYDPLGRRIEKSGNGVTTTYFLSEGTDEIAEYNSGKVVTTRYIPGPAIDAPIAMETASTGAKEYFHTDRQGSIVAMSDSTGNLVEGPYIYDAWGNCFIGIIACSTSGEPYRFTGRRLDSETGLYYYRARYYDPAKGRFLQTDPVGYKADLNLYTYVGNDPSDKTDSGGLSCDTDPKTGKITDCKVDKVTGQPTSTEKTQLNNYLRSVTKATKILQSLDPKTKVQMTVDHKTMQMTAGEALSDMIGRNLVADFNNTDPNIGMQTGPNEQGVTTTTITAGGLAGAPVPGLTPVRGDHLGEIDVPATKEQSQMVEAVHDLGFHGSQSEQSTFGTPQQIFRSDPNWNQDHQSQYDAAAAKLLGIPYTEP
jgi:RHS repeat-associated protein